MSITTLQGELRTKAATRDALAEKLRDLRHRAADIDARKLAADTAAADAAAAHRTALAAAAAGEAGADPHGLLRERQRAADALDELVTTSAGLDARIVAVEREHTAAVRAAAQIRERLAVAIASQRELELRAATKVFATVKRRWHQAAAAAADARREATGRVGEEPVVHTGWSASLLVRGHDEGLRGILAQHGIAPDLTPVGVRGLTESELLEVGEPGDPADARRLAS